MLWIAQRKIESKIRCAGLHRLRASKKKGALRPPGCCGDYFVVEGVAGVGAGAGVEGVVVVVWSFFLARPRGRRGLSPNSRSRSLVNPCSALRMAPMRLRRSSPDLNRSRRWRLTSWRSALSWACRFSRASASVVSFTISVYRGVNCGIASSWGFRLVPITFHRPMISVPALPLEDIVLLLSWDLPVPVSFRGLPAKPRRFLTAPATGPVLQQLRKLTALH